MKLLNYNIKPLFLFSYSIVALVIIGYIDYFTGPEISPLLIYLIPVFFVGLHKNSNKLLIISIGLFAAMIWFIAEYNSKVYSTDLIIVWNTFVRLIIFVVFGLILFQLNERFKGLQELNNKLNLLNMEKNRIIGIAAHDLKNPIGSIKQLTEILLTDLKEELTTEVKEIAGYIEELSANSFYILNSLLDVSKIESGIVEIMKTNQDYISFVKKSILINQLLANKKNINLNFKSEYEQKNFEFDENHLSEVLNNLLTNAIKFSNANTDVEINVSLFDATTIRTSVEDRGKGIQSNEHHKLFNYFQKTSTTPTDGESSTGLGLAISKKIIIEHGGSIGFESEPNKGSKFYFDLSF